MQLGHPPVVEVLAAAHRVGEVHAPVVAVVDVRHRGGHAAFGHHRVRLAEERFADEADAHALRRRFDRRAQPGAAGADDEHVVFDRFVFCAHRILKSCQIPIEHRRTYRSANATPKRLIHAHFMCQRFRQLEQSYATFRAGCRDS